jgi:hypothetical protein
MYKIIVLIALVLGLNSCERPEKAIQPYDRGGVTTTTIPMASNYKFQIFYSLDSNKIVKSVSRMDWDLAFSSSDTPIILTNTGRGIYVAPTNKANLNEVTDTTGLKFYWGQPSLNMDSLAFGKWWIDAPKVFVINMGYDLNGIPLGFIKCIPQLQSDKSLKITWSALENNIEKSIVINKDLQLNFNYVSLLNNKLADIEPPKDKWDLLFTQYVKLLFAPPYPATRNYEVVGAMINPWRIEVGFGFKRPFNEINNTDIPSEFYNHRDAIGFDWKWFDIGTNSYTVNPSMNYILKTSEGFYYKLHFLDFYDAQGVKGFPKFEFSKI